MTRIDAPPGGAPPGAALLRAFIKSGLALAVVIIAFKINLIAGIAAAAVAAGFARHLIAAIARAASSDDSGGSRSPTGARFAGLSAPRRALALGALAGVATFMLLATWSLAYNDTGTPSVGLSTAATAGLAADLAVMTIIVSLPANAIAARSRWWARGRDSLVGGAESAVTRRAAGRFRRLVYHEPANKWTPIAVGT